MCSGVMEPGSVSQASLLFQISQKLMAQQIEVSQVNTDLKS